MFAGGGMITVIERYYSIPKRLRTSGLSYVKSAQLPRPPYFKVFDDGCIQLSIYTVARTSPLLLLTRLPMYAKNHLVLQYNKRRSTRKAHEEDHRKCIQARQHKHEIAIIRLRGNRRSSTFIDRGFVG